MLDRLVFNSRNSFYKVLYMGYAQVIGRQGEELASRFLKKQGYKILETNYSCALGEVDIIAADRDILAFVEVKTRSGCEFGYPEEAINRKKQRRLMRIAQIYLDHKKLNGVSCRFDVVAIIFSSEGRSVNIELIKDAFQEK